VTGSGAPTGRRYRFGSRDTTGWLVGLGGAQCGALGAGILAAGMLLTRGVALPIVLGPLVLAAGVSFGRWNGHPIYALLPTVLAWWTVRRTGRDRWYAPIPLVHPARTDGRSVALPAPLDGLELVDGRTRAGATCGLVLDRRERTATVVLRPQSSRFSLCDPGEQDRLVALWGDVLAGFCTERASIGRLRWMEFAAPGQSTGELAYLDEHTEADRPAIRDYRDLVARAGPASSCHEVLLAVTIEQRRLRRTHRATGEAGLIDAAVAAAELVAQRLDRAELGPAPPLTAGALGAVLRSRLDPFSLPRPTSGASLATLVGFVPAAHAGPMVMQAAWDHVRVDRAFHAAYAIAEWPRLEVPANWMEPLLLHAGATRTIAMHYEPVPPSRSARRVDREAVKLTADEEHRARSGFRIGARHERAQSEVTAREHELVAGYAELEYVGFVIITAPTLDDLRDACEDYEQVALGCGLELRRLDGRHDLALACALPVGRGVAARRFP
jgi:hypothetical protein